jgi:hypothetical protein
MKTHVRIIGITFLLASGRIFGQCVGVDVGGGSCVPPNAPGMPGYPNLQRQIVRPIWQDRWGAIAIDLSTLDAGTMDGRLSKSEAERYAMASCMSEGSKNCKVVLTFFNQCAALVVGERISWSKAPTKDKAEKSAIEGCGSADQCRVVYSACNYPVIIR